ncbi:MAG TPA: hypothetical protein VN936_01345 [Candidatus Acidoferrum sp.]|nr:hypothetical protein [Candidatus Acidoferrum sp.]
MKTFLSTLTFRAFVFALLATPCTFPVPGRSDTPVLAVGPQYGTTHVYVAPADFDRFVASFKATLDGSGPPKSVVTVTPTASKEIWQPIITPYGSISVFAFTTPIPYPFGLERGGYLVSDFDKAMTVARDSGASMLVAPFPDPIGKDAIVQWPGGVEMQLYWHTTTPHNAALATIPENRVYVSPDAADSFIRDFVRFSGGTVASDDANAAGIEVGTPGQTYRRIRIDSTFGKIAVLVTNGQLPYPFGRETTGYEVPNLDDTLAKAQKAGVTVLVPPYTSDGRRSTIVMFPGGYIAEIHALVTR